MRRLACIVAVVGGAACTCAQIDPNLEYRCDPQTGDGCPRDSGADAGADGGTDAGRLDGGSDGGTDAGRPDGGSDGGTDAGRPDGGSDAGFDAGCIPSQACNDDDVCTITDICLANGGGCRGEATGVPIFQCVGAGSNGTVFVLNSICGASICISNPDAGAPLFRQLTFTTTDTDARIWSPQFVVSGNCASSNWDVCGDWHVADTGPASYCVTNVFGPVWPARLNTPPRGTVPVYQYRSAAGVHSFGRSSQAPPNTMLDPIAPVFHACPP